MRMRVYKFDSINNIYKSTICYFYNHYNIILHRYLAPREYNTTYTFYNPNRVCKYL